MSATEVSVAVRAQRAAAPQDGTPAISVIVPVSERPESLDGIFLEFSEPIRATGRSFEFLFVVDGNHARLVDSLDRLIEDGHPIRVHLAGPGLSETALLRLGVAAARGEIVVTLPAYRQVEAHAIPPMLDRLEQGVDMVVARRWPRRDALINRLQSRAFHLMLGRMKGHGLHDVACGVRVAWRSVLATVPLYGDSVRFLPLIAQHDGCRVVELDARQHRDDMRGRIYRPGIYVRRALDVLGMFFLLRFIEKPLRFFGLLGFFLSAIGSGILLVLLYDRLSGQAIGQRPVMLVGALLLMLGVQSIALGLVGELIVHFNAPDQRTYRLADAPADAAPRTPK